MLASIGDHTLYNEELSKSLPCKLFFLDLIKTRLYVDFGCGDGSILKSIREQQEDAILFGVENDPVQFSLAAQHALVFPTFTHFELGDYEWATKTAIFSSVLHESPGLLETAVAYEFDYIVIRDMALLPQYRTRERELEAALKEPYRGTPSWEREKEEQYFRLSALAYITRPPEGYEVFHFEHFSIPVIRERLGEDIPTHVKVIYKRTARKAP